MKKSFPSNINGKIFYIDEDAYELLNSYITSLHATFPGEEGREVVEDIETRIAELFDERVSARGSQVVSIADVNEVIRIMGRPEELGDVPEQPGEAREAEQNGRETPPPFNGTTHKKLYRDMRNKVFGGVLSGLGCYIGWDVTVMRILAVVLALSTYFWPCVLVYLLAWMVIPVARTPRQILEMQGEPVNLGSVGQTVIDSSQQSVPGESGFGSMANTVAQVIGVFVMGFVGLVCGIAAISFIVIGLVLIAGMICYGLGAGYDLLESMDISLSTPYLSGWGMTCAMFACALPMIALAWAGCCVVFKAPSAPRAVVITGVVVEILLIVAAGVLINMGGDFDDYSSLLLIGAPASLLTAPMS